MSEIKNFINVIEMDALERKRIEEMVKERFHVDISIDHGGAEVMATWDSIDKTFGGGAGKDIRDYMNHKNGLLIITDGKSELIQNDENLAEYIERESQGRLYSDLQAELEEKEKEIESNIANDQSLTSYNI